MQVPKRSRGGYFPLGHSGRRRRTAGTLAALATAAGLLTACGGDGGTPTLIWYTNPDPGGQAAIAERCTADSDGAYKIETQVLPQDATQQRVQLARRLAAGDSSIDTGPGRRWRKSGTQEGKGRDRGHRDDQRDDQRRAICFRSDQRRHCRHAAKKDRGEERATARGTDRGQTPACRIRPPVR